MDVAGINVKVGKVLLETSDNLLTALPTVSIAHTLVGME